MINAEDSGEPRVYAVRVVPRVAAGIDEEYSRQAQSAGEVSAKAWEEGLLTAMASLATLPRRCAVAAEDVLFSHGPLLVLLYRVRRSRAAWRILFTVDEAGDDGPCVYVRLVRRAEQMPLSAWPAEDV